MVPILRALAGGLLALASPTAQDPTSQPATRPASRPVVSAERRIRADQRPGFHHAAVAGRVVTEDGKPAAGAEVVLRAYHQRGPGLPMAATRTGDEGAFTFADVTTDGAVMYWVATADGGHTGRRVELPSGRRTDLGTIRVERPASRPAPTPPRTLVGRFTAPDGTPVPGLLLEGSDAEGRIWRMACAETGRDGQFRLQAESGVTHLQVGSWGRTLKVALAKDDATNELTLTAQPVDLGVAGTQAMVRLALWRGDRWIELDGQRAWVPVGAYGWYVRVRAIAGDAVRVAEADLSGKPDTVGSIPLRFEEPAPCVVRVREGERPLTGARIDFVQDRETDPGAMVLIDSRTTDAQGTVAIDVAAARSTTAFVYAAGFAPARADVTPGGVVDVRLLPRSGRVRVPELPAGSWLRVKPLACAEPAAIAYADGPRAQELDLAPGAYEATLLDAEEQTVRTAVVALAPGTTVDLDLQRDDRPQVQLSLPKPGAKPWEVYLLRTVPTGGAVHWRASSGRNRRLGSFESPGAVLAKDETSFAVTASSCGHRVLVATREDLDLMLVRELELRPGPPARLSVPALDSTLRGTMRTYTQGKDPFMVGHHGIATPRLWLRGGADTFDVMVAMPERGKGDDFAIQHLPAGEYDVFHHLVGENRTFKRNDGSEGSYVRAAKVWGGVRIALPASGAADFGDTAEPGAAACTVQVVDARGRPIPRALVSIRDPMRESWWEVVLDGSTLAHAEDEIPEPPSRRTDAQGRVQFESVRPGRLWLRVRPASDRECDVAVDVRPDAEAVITVPDAR